MYIDVPQAQFQAIKDCKCEGSCKGDPVSCPSLCGDYNLHERVIDGSLFHPKVQI